MKNLLLILFVFFLFFILIGFLGLSFARSSLDDLSKINQDKIESGKSICSKLGGKVKISPALGVPGDYYSCVVKHDYNDYECSLLSLVENTCYGMPDNY